MSTTATAIAVGASAQSSIAMQQAREAKCVGVVDRFDSHTATTVEMREYASCVNTLHPAELSPGAESVFKVVFVIALLGMAVGMWRERGDVLGMICMGVLGFFLAPLGAIFVMGIIIGVRWLFS